MATSTYNPRSMYFQAYNTSHSASHEKLLEDLLEENAYQRKQTDV